MHYEMSTQTQLLRKSFSAEVTLVRVYLFLVRVQRYVFLQLARESECLPTFLTAVLELAPVPFLVNFDVVVRLEHFVAVGTPKPLFGRRHFRPAAGLIGAIHVVVVFLGWLAM